MKVRRERRPEEDFMQVPMWIKPMAWGVVLGAVGTMTVGFTLMGWTLGHTTTRLVAEGRESAVVAALTPFCVASYMKQPDAAKKLALLRADTAEYTQRDIIEKSGFATMPGNTEPTSGVASACVTALRTASLAGPGQRVASDGAGATTK
jgi:hypothetical protein